MGRWADIDAMSPGDAVSCRLVVTESDVDAFAHLSQDFNPLHMDTGAAQSMGFPRRVAHGMLSLSAISRLIGMELPGPGALWISQELKFDAPVLVGDELVARVTVERVSRGAQLVVLRTEVVHSLTERSVLSGTATVKVPRRRVAEVRSDMEQRVALVTGSSRGLGRAIALRLAAEGNRVVVQYHTRRVEADAVVAEITAADGQALAVAADLTRPDAVDALFATAEAAWGRLDILVNNASPPIVRRPWHEYQWADFQAYLDVYLQATFRLCQLAVPGMQARKFGRIVNVVSSSAHGVPPARLLAYVAAKSALAGLSRALAVEVGPLGITVNTVAPSLLVTDQNAAIGERARLLTASQTPLRRLAELDDVAGSVAFLVSDSAAFITGIVMPVAGGEVMPT